MSLTIGRTAADTGRRAVVAPRVIVLLALAIGLAAGFVAGRPGEAAAIAASGDDLTRLLRGMALIKFLFVAAATAATLWRLQAPIGPGRLTLYAVSATAMAAGPGLIWTMTHVAVGAALLHAGLIAALVLLWRDPASTTLLAEALQRRRAARK